MTQNVTKFHVHGVDPWFIEDPPIHRPYPFEDWIDVNEMRLLAKTNIIGFIAISVLYYIFISVGPKLMQTRKAFDLQGSLVFWNLFVAVFSIMGTIRSAPELLGILSQPNGFYKSVCVREGLNQPFVFWGTAFAVSKSFELVDTAFIILRKKNLIFLHWFHHLTMAYITPLLAIEGEPISRYASIINYSVHSIMYTYFALMSLKIKVPKKISMAITSLQLVQFMTLLALNIYSLIYLYMGKECYRTTQSFMVYFTVGTMYLLLFARFFYHAYISKPKQKEL